MRGLENDRYGEVREDLRDSGLGRLAVYEDIDVLIIYIYIRRRGATFTATDSWLGTSN